MTGESTPSFVMGIVTFAIVVMLLFPAFFGIFFKEIEDQKTQEIEKTLKENNLLKDNEKVSPTKMIKILAALFTFDAEKYGMSDLMSKITSIIFTVCFYSATLALASIYWPLIIIAGIAAFIQSLSISHFIPFLKPDNTPNNAAPNN